MAVGIPGKTKTRIYVPGFLPLTLLQPERKMAVQLLVKRLKTPYNTILNILKISPTGVTACHPDWIGIGTLNREEPLCIHQGRCRQSNGRFLIEPAY